MAISQATAATVREPHYRLAQGQWTFNRAFRAVEAVTRRGALEFHRMVGELGSEGVDKSGILLIENHGVLFRLRKTSPLGRRF